MDIEPKDGVYALSLAAAFGAGWSWVKTCLRGQKDINKKTDARIDNIENKLVDKKGNPLLMSYASYERMCSNKQEKLLVEMQYITQTMSDIKTSVNQHTGKLNQVCNSISVLQDRWERELKK